MRKHLILFSCLAALLTAACTGESERPQATGEGVIRAINSIPTAPEMLFLIEERPVANVDYSRISTRVEFDDLEYLFNWDVTFPGELERTRVASTLMKVEKDVQYTFLASGDLNAPLITIWEKPVREWGETETVFEARFAHTADSLGPIDVYFDAPGVAPAMGAAIGTLSFGEILPVADYATGDWVYTFTTAGNPGDVLFTSTTLAPAAATGILISIFDASANDTGDYAVRIFFDNGGSGNIVGENESPTVRFIHANSTIGNTDIYTDNLVTDQILANHAYRDVTGDIDLDSGLYFFTYTPAGNPGLVLAGENLQVNPATHNQIYLFGDTTSPVVALRIPDRRSVETTTKFFFLHTAENHPFVDFYLLDAGEVLEDENPIFRGVSPGLATPVINPAPGDKEMYLTVAGEKTIIAGPVPLTISLGDVFEYLSFDNVDPATADLVEIPLP